MTTRETHSPGDDCPGGHQDEAMTTETEKRALEGDPEAGLKWAAELWNKLQERKAAEPEAPRGGSDRDSCLLGNVPPRRAGVEKLAEEIVTELWNEELLAGAHAVTTTEKLIAAKLDAHLDALVPDSGALVEALAEARDTALQHATTMPHPECVCWDELAAQLNAALAQAQQQPPQDGALVEARTLLGRLTEEDLSSKEIGRITEDARRFLAQAQQPGPAVARGLDAQREADVRLAQYLMQRSANPDDSPWGEHDIANWIGDWRRAEAEA